MEEGERSPVVAQRPNGQAGAGVWKEPASSKSPASAASTTTPSASAASSSPSSAGRGGAARGGAARGGAARGGGGASASGGFAGLAKMLGSKAKEAKAATASGGTGPGQKSRSVSPRSKKAEHEDDLPLGSEAHSLTDQSNGIDSKPQEPREQRSKWLKTATMMGWQSFNSDVSNQTSASSASLEMLLQERQMDPEQMLMNLGFGGQAPAYVPSLARVPERFLSHPSRAYGIDVQSSTEDGEGDDQGDGGGGGGGGEEAARPGTPSGGVNTSGGGGGGGATTVAKKRTGGFYFQGLFFWPQPGYVDLMSLWARDVPSHFFNREGSKCYFTADTLTYLRACQAKGQKNAKRDRKRKVPSKKRKDVQVDRSEAGDCTFGGGVSDLDTSARSFNFEKDELTSSVCLDNSLDDHADLKVCDPDFNDFDGDGPDYVNVDAPGLPEVPGTKSRSNEITLERVSYQEDKDSSSRTEENTCQTENMDGSHLSPLEEPRQVRESSPSEKVQEKLSKYLGVSYVRKAAKKLGESISERIHRKSESGSDREGSAELSLGQSIVKHIGNVALSSAAQQRKTKSLKNGSGESNTLGIQTGRENERESGKSLKTSALSASSSVEDRTGSVKFRGKQRSFRESPEEDAAVGICSVQNSTRTTVSEISSVVTRHHGDVTSRGLGSPGLSRTPTGSKKSSGCLQGDTWQTSAATANKESVSVPVVSSGRRDDLCSVTYAAGDARVNPKVEAVRAGGKLTSGTGNDRAVAASRPRRHEPFRESDDVLNVKRNCVSDLVSQDDNDQGNVFTLETNDAQYTADDNELEWCYDRDTLSLSSYSLSSEAFNSDAPNTLKHPASVPTDNGNICKNPQRSTSLQRQASTEASPLRYSPSDQFYDKTHTQSDVDSHAKPVSTTNELQGEAQMFHTAVDTTADDLASSLCDTLPQSVNFTNLYKSDSPFGMISDIDNNTLSCSSDNPNTTRESQPVTTNANTFCEINEKLYPHLTQVPSTCGVIESESRTSSAQSSQGADVGRAPCKPPPRYRRVSRSLSSRSFFQEKRRPSPLTSEAAIPEVATSGDPTTAPTRPPRRPPMRRRTSTGSVWPGRAGGDDFSRLSAKDFEEMDMSNVSTSSSDSEDEPVSSRRGSVISEREETLV